MPHCSLRAQGHQVTAETRDPEWIKQQREAGWPDMHPEDFCHKCGTRNMSWATVTREDWLTATAAWAAETGREGICCPQCFAEMYDERTGRKACWILTRDGASIPIGAPAFACNAHCDTDTFSGISPTCPIHAGLLPR